MDTGENKRAIIVGLFIALGVIIFIVGVFTLGSNQKTFGGSLQLKSVFDDVAGLKKGGGVFFSGVKEGTVSAINFKGASHVEVQINIDKNVQQFIHRNATLRISSEGLIGNKTIVIDGGSPQAPVVQSGDFLQAEKILSTDDITKTLQKNNQNLLAITTDFKKVSRQMAEGKGMVGMLLNDSTLTAKFRSIVDNLRSTTVVTSRLAGDLEKFGVKLNTKGTLADKLLTDTVTYGVLHKAVDNLQKSTAKTSILVDNLNKASDKLNDPHSLAGTLLADPKMADTLRSILSNLKQSSVKLNEDLEAARHNFLLKGYFNDKEKARKDSLKKAGKK